jgi:hypothetical protein
VIWKLAVSLQGAVSRMSCLNFGGLLKLLTRGNFISFEVAQMLELQVLPRQREEQTQKIHENLQRIESGKGFGVAEVDKSAGT